jgi:hypothetical protein
MVEETFEPGTTVSLVARRHGVAPNQLFTWRRLVLSRPGPPATNLPVVAQPHQLRAEQYRKFRGETWLQDQLFASQTCGRVTAGRGRRLGSVLSSHSFGERIDLNLIEIRHTSKDELSMAP